MKELHVSIEIEGKQCLVGVIEGKNCEDARFKYADEYLSISGIRPISISLPLQKGYFSPRETKCFFEGLLPEGFSRRAVASWAKVDESDYLAILEKLGQECLGAICVLGSEENINRSSYEPLTYEQVHALASEGADRKSVV